MYIRMLYIAINFSRFIVPLVLYYYICRAMLIQLSPPIPVYVPEFDMEGYAFLVRDDGIEHYLFFTIMMDNGEIWTLDNRRIRACVNHTASRSQINKSLVSAFVSKLKSPQQI
jgi:hypothetical protein